MKNVWIFTIRTFNELWKLDMYVFQKCKDQNRISASKYASWENSIFVVLWANSLATSNVFFWKFNLVIWQVFIKNGFLPQYALHSKICISSKIRFFGNFQILRSGMIFGDFYSLIFYLPNDVFRSKPILSLWCNDARSFGISVLMCHLL